MGKINSPGMLIKIEKKYNEARENINDISCLLDEIRHDTTDEKKNLLIVVANLNNLYIKLKRKLKE